MASVSGLEDEEEEEEEAEELVGGCGSGGKFILAIHIHYC